MRMMNGSANGHHKRLMNGKPLKPLMKPQKPSVDGSVLLPLAPVEPSGDGGAGRDAGGRFTFGNRGGKGNPFARRVAALRSALLAELNEARLKRLTAKLFDQAMEGDVAAAKLVLAYSVGKPVDSVDPDRLDLDEWKLLNENPSKSEGLRVLLDSVPAGELVNALFAAWAVTFTKDPLKVLPLDKQSGMSNELLKRVASEINRRVEKK